MKNPLYELNVKPIRTEKQKAIDQVFSSYKASANFRGILFNLPKDSFTELILGTCEYCSSEPSNTAKLKRKSGEITYSFKYNGIDRKDNQIGYEDFNCVTCCGNCNSMKRDSNSEEFIEHAAKIIKNQRIKNTISSKKLDYYLDRAISVSKASPDAETKVGAILIHGESGAVIAEGYNGFIRGANDEVLPKTRPDKYDFIIHAEMNLLCNAVRHGVSTNGCIIYCTLSPCVRCLRTLYQAGIKTIYFKKKYGDFQTSGTMGDLLIECTEISEHYKICLSPKITE